MMSEEENLQIYLLNKIHQQIAITHSKIKKTVKLLIFQYYWSDMTKNIEQYVINCYICWQVKHFQDLFFKLLQSLLILQKSWQYIMMNFFFLLKNNHEYDAAFMIMNRLSKCFYSLSCIKKITAKNMIRLYVVYIYQIYKFSDIIISDHSFQFISDFWKKFCKILSIKLKLSTIYHFQTNSQTEIINQHIIQCLCFYVNYYQND